MLRGGAECAGTHLARRAGPGVTAALSFGPPGPAWPGFGPDDAGGPWKTKLSGARVTGA